jgi:transposase
LEVLSRVKRGEMHLKKAAELLQLSYRQAKRVYGRYRREGDKGLVHRLRGQPSNRQFDKQQRERVLSQYRDTYADFGPTLAAEYLAKEGIVVAAETLRRWLMAEGLWQNRRKRAAHRSWRPRKDYLGEMVQMDGSHHDWFEGRRPRAVLMVMIDDASNRTYARFFEAEATEAAFATFSCYVARYGLPCSLYVDKDSIYRTTRDATIDETLADEPAKTQFGRAMTELDVALILANSPQAKGRVERRNGVFQDRLVKAMRLAGIADLETANGYLDETFLPELNARFTVAAKAKTDLHRRVPAGVDLARVLAFQEERAVQNDWTLRWRNRWFQLTAANGPIGLAGKRVLVCEQFDGKIRLFYRERELEWQELTGRPARAPKATEQGQGESRRNGTSSPKSRKPAADHPWRRFKLR